MKQLLVILTLFFSSCAVAQKQRVNLLPTDMEQMLSWFKGEFDNFQLVYKEKEDSVKEVHEHIHSIFYKVSLPAIGKHVFYVYQYMDGDEKKVYRQRIYNFSIDNIDKAIRLNIYSFITDSLYYFLYKDSSKLKNLTMNNLTSTDGCEVYWKKDADAFIGYMKSKAYNFIFKQSGKKIFITDSLRLIKDEIQIRDEAEDANGNYVSGHKGKIPYKLKRCRYYTGGALLQKAGFENEYEVQRGVSIHDQGGRVRVLTTDDDLTKYSVELSCVEYGKNLEVLKIALYEDKNSKAVMYAWASPGSIILVLI